MKQKIVLGMSGGVDSSVAALLLQKQGWEVVGMFMNCGSRGNSMWPSSIDWKKEERDVKEICKKLGIKLIVRDCEIGYEKKVISKMFGDYSKGLTPNPDILCNNVGKFPLLLQVAKEVGANRIATGHYARVQERKGKYELLRGKDNEKDQSYFLVGLGQKHFRKCLFPIGDLKKGEVRRIAKEEGFGNYGKRSSRGICYLGKIDVKKFLKLRIKERKGDVFDADGELIGSHSGVMFFTIGERAGEGKGFAWNKIGREKYSGKRLFVARKSKGNKIVVGIQGEGILKTKKVGIIRMKLVDSSEKIDGKKFKARIRHLGSLESGKLIKEKGKWIFVFDKAGEGIASGQFLVLYDGERLVGGGEIRLK